MSLTYFQSSHFKNNIQEGMFSSKPNPYEFSPRNPYDSPKPIPSRPPSQRPNVESYYYASQQPKTKKDFGLFSRRYLPKENPSTSRSRISQQNVSMTASMLPEDKLYSEEMLFLLSEEENNTKYFKEKVEVEKGRVSRDFENARKQIEHLMSDL